MQYKKQLWPVALIITGIISSIPTVAQNPLPATDIYLVQLSKDGESFKVGTPENITNRGGYDNQPSFLSDSENLIYTSIREDNQADIYAYNLIEHSTLRIVYTRPESEYSPTLMPDGGGISVVRVERDSTQRLWRFPFIESDPVLLMAKVKNIGYHAWVDSQTVALFVLGNPPTLQLANLQQDSSKIITSGIGRCLRLKPNTKSVTFIQKTTPDQWFVKLYDTDSEEIDSVVETVAGSEDYEWYPDGSTLFMASGSKLFSWQPDADASWHEIADFSAAGLAEISRLAISSDGNTLALVAGRKSAN